MGDEEMALLEAEAHALAEQYEQLRAAWLEKCREADKAQTAMNHVILDQLRVGAEMDRLEKRKGA